MTKKKCIIGLTIVVVVLISLFCWYCFYDGTLIRLEIKVVDELGNPVENVLVNGYFDDSRHKDGGGKVFRLISDESGVCNVIGVARVFVGLRLRKDGFYESRYRVLKLRHGDEVSQNTTVVIKKIKNPVAMQVRKVELTFPELEKYYPFDCSIGDWVEPYGRGKKAHIYISFRTF